jgi:hypothetical protein
MADTIITNYYVYGDYCPSGAVEREAEPIEPLSCYIDPGDVDTFDGVFKKAMGVLPTLGGQVISTDSNYDDLLTASYDVVCALVDAWPRTMPTLDEVRNGRASADGIPVTPRTDLPPLRGELFNTIQAKMPIKVNEGRIEDMVEAVITLLKDRRNMRRLPASTLPPNEDDVPQVRAFAPRVATTRAKAPHHFEKGETTCTIIMRHYHEGMEFGVDDAKRWLDAVGYNPTSYSSAMTAIVRKGHCRVIQSSPRRWKFRVPLAEGEVFSCNWGSERG